MMCRPTDIDYLRHPSFWRSLSHNSVTAGMWRSSLERRRQTTVGWL